MRTIFPVCDLHADTPFELLHRQEGLAENTCHISLKQSEQLSPYIQFYAFCTYGGKWQEYRLPEPEAHFLQMLTYFRRELSENSRRICLCTCAEELSQAQGRAAAFLSVEGAEAIACDPGRLQELRELGVTMLNLTWNGENALAGSHLSGGGLTEQGREFVRRAQELGILIDVSHLSQQAFNDLCGITTAPLMASHSNARACCDCSRNLTDEEIKRICGLGGMIGLNLYPPCFSGADTATFDDVRRHMEHFLDIGAGEHLCLGGDLDGCDRLVEGFAGIGSYQKLGQYLLRCGMEEETVLGVYYNHMADFLQKNMRRRA